MAVAVEAECQEVSVESSVAVPAAVVVASADKEDVVDMTEMVVLEAVVTEVPLKVGRVDQEVMAAEAAHTAADSVGAQGDWARWVDLRRAHLEDRVEVAVSEVAPAVA